MIRYASVLIGTLSKLKVLKSVSIIQTQGWG